MFVGEWAGRWTGEISRGRVRLAVRWMERRGEKKRNRGGGRGRGRGIGIVIGIERRRPKQIKQLVRVPSSCSGKTRGNTRGTTQATNPTNMHHRILRSKRRRRGNADGNITTDTAQKTNVLGGRGTLTDLIFFLEKYRTLIPRTCSPQKRGAVLRSPPRVCLVGEARRAASGHCRDTKAYMVLL